MNMDKAIKLLQRDLDDFGFVDYNDRAKAQELGIEAMTYIKLLRQTNPQDVPALFRGETKE